MGTRIPTRGSRYLLALQYFNSRGSDSLANRRLSRTLNRQTCKGHYLTLYQVLIHQPPQVLMGDPLQRPDLCVMIPLVVKLRDPKPTIYTYGRRFVKGFNYRKMSTRLPSHKYTSTYLRPRHHRSVYFTIKIS